MNLGVTLYRTSDGSSTPGATGTTDLQGKVRFYDLAAGGYHVSFDRYYPYYYGTFDLDGSPG